MRRVFLAVLAALWAITPVLAQNVQRGGERLIRQRAALDSLPAAVEVALDEHGVPTNLRGELSARESADARIAAEVALEVHGLKFRRGVEDTFVARLQESDELGQTHVRMAQFHKGYPVVGGELIVHMDADRIVGINGRFVADLDVDTVRVLSDENAVARAIDAVAKDGGKFENVVEIGDPVIYAQGGEPRLAIPVKAFYGFAGEPHMDIVEIDAQTGDVLGFVPQLYTAKFRKIYDLKQACISTGSELPGTLLFQEGGSSTDSAAMGAYNGTGLTYDYYKTIFSRDSYDNAGGTLQSSVHGQFSTGWFSCTKNNAAWLDSPYNQMAYGDGDGTTFSNLANGIDVTGHELTHGVCARTANLAYQNESGALNEGNSDILGRSAAFWGGNGNPATKTDWAIGADVYTPGTAGDALRYMYDPAKDGQSADYYPTRNYASGCTPSSSNDQCGVHTNSGIANLFYYLLSQGGTHPRGKTTVSVTGVGLSAAQQIWYRALVAYMTSSTTFQAARTATANAAADLYGGSCSATWQSVQKGWDAVGVPGTWSCTTTFSIAGNAGTASASVSAGAASTTADATGAFTIAGLAAGTYTVTPSKSGCTFSPTSKSVTVGPNATGVNFTASCGATTYSIAGNAGTATALVSAGTASTTADATGAFTIASLTAGTYTVTPSKSGCTFSPTSKSVTVGPNATGVNFTATCGVAPQQLFLNPGFESGNVNWTTTAGVIDNSVSMPARTGSWKAWMCGYGTTHTDTMYQAVTIPAGATKATLSFYLRVDSAETTTVTQYDTLKVQVRNSAGTLLATLATYSNLNKGSVYNLKSFDLTAYKGQTIRIHFLASEDISLQTGFLIDDTALNVQ